MASGAEILEVRQNTNEPDNVDPFTDAVIGALIDAGSVDSASGAIWRKKAAAYSDLYNQSEAGASSAKGDLFKHAETMAQFYEAKIGGTDKRPKVNTIVRTT